MQLDIRRSAQHAIGWGFKERSVSFCNGIVIAILNNGAQIFERKGNLTLKLEGI